MSGKNYVTRQLCMLLSSGTLFMTSVCFANQAPGISEAGAASAASKTVQQAMRKASTPQDYALLARYFRTQQRLNQTKAQAEQERYAQALRTVAIPKYPATADTAKWFAQEYTGKAEAAALLAEEFERKSSLADASAAKRGEETSSDAVQRKVLREITALEKQTQGAAR